MPVKHHDRTQTALAENFPLSYCKDLTNHLGLVLAHEGNQLTKLESFTAFIQEHTQLQHKYAVGLAKAAKTAKMVLKGSNDNNSSLSKALDGFYKQMTSIATDQSATMAKINKEVLTTLERFQTSANGRHEANADEFEWLREQMNDEKKSLDEDKNYCVATLEKLSKCSPHKDKKKWMRRRNKAVARLHHYKMALTVANNRANEARLTDVPSLLTRMQSEEEQLFELTKTSINQYCQLYENKGEPIQKRLRALSDSIDLGSDLKLMICDILKKDRQREERRQNKDKAKGKKTPSAFTFPLPTSTQESEETTTKPTHRGRSQTMGIDASPKISKVPKSPRSNEGSYNSLSPSVALHHQQHRITSRSVIMTPKEKEAFLDEMKKNKVEDLKFDFSYEIDTPQELWGAEAGGESCFFFSTLDAIMEYQARAMPALHAVHGDKPVVVDVLMRGISYTGNGLREEGVGIVMSEPLVTKAQIQNVRQQLESGNFRVELDSPHVAVAMFHTWLRELADPLIPHSLYQKTLGVIREETDAQEIDRRLTDLIKNGLSVVQWRVLDRVMGLFSSIVQYQDRNNVTLEQLCATFGQSILRGPSNSEQKIPVKDQKAANQTIEALHRLYTTKWQTTEVGIEELFADASIFSDTEFHCDSDTAAQLSTAAYNLWDYKPTSAVLVPSISGRMKGRDSITCCVHEGCRNFKHKRGYCLRHLVEYLREHTKTHDDSALKVEQAAHAKRIRRLSMGMSDTSTREKVRGEIIATEESYVKGLLKLKEFFVDAIMKPTTEKGTKAMIYIPEERKQTMVRDIEPICNFQANFLQELKDSPPFGLPAVFVKYSDFLKMYSAYLNNFETRLAAINKLSSKKKKFKEYRTFIEANLMQGEGGLDLASYLIQPVQRVPRYVLLLEELTKNTSVNRPEYKMHITALEKIRFIANHINKSKRLAESLAKLTQIQQKVSGFDGDLVAPHRQLTREGALFVVSSSKKSLGFNKTGKVKERYVYIFNDMIFWVNTQTLTFKGKIMLTVGASVVELPNGDIELATHKQVFVARVENTNERESWLATFQETIRAQKFISARMRTAQAKRGSERFKLDVNSSRNSFNTSLLNNGSPGSTSLAGSPSGNFDTFSDIDLGSVSHLASTARSSLKSIQGESNMKKLSIDTGAGENSIKPPPVILTPK